MDKKIIAAFISMLFVLMSFGAAYADDVPYTVSLKGTVEIYNGPGYDYGFARYVGSDGVYTIVEEAVCEFGYLWGRLKSGAGWVMLKRVVVDGEYIEDVSYTMNIAAGTPVYAGPGYDNDYVCDVEENGVYTIVAESYCNEGHLWGKLKSGLGWIMLEAAVASEDSYTVQLGYWVPIFNGPGYDYGFARYVDENGVYTIVTEQLDDEGNVWGELKSGAGWVDLTNVRVSGEPVLTVMYTDEAFIESSDCYVSYVEDSMYTTYIVFRTSETVYDLDLTVLQPGENGGYITGTILDSFGIFYEEAPVVTGLIFTGDVTTYGISFLDENDTMRYFAIYISGRNGELVVDEYIP